AALQRPLPVQEDRGAKLEQLRPFARDVLRALQQQLGRLRGDLHLDTEAVRLFDQLEQLALAEALVRDDQLVNVAVAQDARKRVKPAEHPEVARIAARSDGADEFVLDAAATRPERPAQIRELPSLPDENGAPADAGKAKDIPREHLVACAQDPDEQSGEDERRRRQAVRREVVARSEPERERDHGDDGKRGDDLAEPGAQLAPAVEPAD